MPAGALRVDEGDLRRIVEGRHHDPHSILGPHRHDGRVTIRVLRPWATRVAAIFADGTSVDLQHEFGGIFVGVAPFTDIPDYRLEIEYGAPAARTDDPYRFLPTLGELDLHLIREGRHETLWTVLGAHERTFPSVMGDVHGTSFSVWAPSAQGVRLVGEHNHWDGAAHPLRSLGSSGIWEIFIPGISAGSRYKFAILGQDGVWRTKADPMARHTASAGYRIRRLLIQLWLE
jgi:1,4-alpha-glucan branching enzyme